MEQNEYIRSLFVKSDPMLDQVLQTIQQHDMPMISVSPEVGQLLTLLVRMSGAKQLLEIGALGGYSGICLLRGLSEDGHLTSLELEQKYADMAYENVTKAGFGNQVTYYVGEALDSLAKIEQEQKRFDFFLIDADKANYSNYLEWAIRLANPGAIILADNVLWSGRVLDVENDEPSTQALRAFNQKVGSDERLEAMLVPIGDGVTIARVK